MVVAIAVATVIAILLVATIAIYLRHGGPLAIGLSDFEERKNLTLARLCQIVLGYKLKNFTSYCCFLTRLRKL